MSLRKSCSVMVPFAVLALCSSVHITLAADGGTPISGMPGWFQADIGDVGLAGNATQNDDTWHVTGAGSDIWGTADSFHFVYIPIDGDADMDVLVRSQSAQQMFAKAGLMIRQTLDPSSPHVVFDVKPDGGIELMTRPAAGSATTFVKGGSGTPTGTFLRLHRRGNQVSAFISDSSHCSMGCENWSPFSDSPITLPPGPALIGLAVTSHDPAVLNSATLDFWDLSTLAAPWQQTRFYDAPFTPTAATGVDGGSFPAGTLSVPAGGSDIWGSTDSFNFAWQPMASDGTITAQVTSVPGTNPFAKAGVMMRGTLTAGSPEVILDVKPDGGIEFMTRTADGAETNFLAGGTASLPVYLRLQRSQNGYGALYSQDSSSWTQLGSVTVDAIGHEYFGGLAATTHDPAASPFTFAGFAHVSVFAFESTTNLLANPGFEESSIPNVGPGWASDRATPATTETTTPRSGAVNAACTTTTDSDCGRQRQR